MDNRVVLVVEDEPDVRDMLQTLVEEFTGLPAIAAEDGERALKLVESRPPALILLDIMLPGISGLEVAHELRGGAKTKDIPIIAVTAGATREETIAAGCSDFVAKPFDLDRLIGKMRQYLPELAASLV